MTSTESDDSEPSSSDDSTRPKTKKTAAKAKTVIKPSKTTTLSKEVVLDGSTHHINPIDELTAKGIA